jgi:hypothetical protein
MIKKLIKWFKEKHSDYKRRRRLKKKIAEIRKNDPFTYNH